MTVGTWILFALLGAIAVFSGIVLFYSGPQQDIEERKSKVRDAFNFILIAAFVIGAIWALIESQS